MPLTAVVDIIAAAKICTETVLNADRAAPGLELCEAIERNVAMARQVLAEMAGEALPPCRAGVARLDGFIDRQRDRMLKTGFGNLPSVVGCYVGEALISAAGGRWIYDREYGLGVEFAPSIVAFPVNKAEKHCLNGAEDSMLGFYDVSLELVEEHRRRSLVSPSDPV